jgi:hypothetical protein
MDRDPEFASGVGDERHQADPTADDTTAPCDVCKAIAAGCVACETMFSCAKLSGDVAGFDSLGADGTRPGNTVYTRRTVPVEIENILTEAKQRSAPGSIPTYLQSATNDLLATAKTPLPPYVENWLNAHSPGGVWVQPSDQARHDPAPPSGNHDHGDIVTRRVIPWLANSPPAISGSSGSSRTMSVARTVCWEFGLGEAGGFDVLWDHWNPRCEPPWTESELRHKCHDAMDPSKAQTAFGHKRDEELQRRENATPTRPVQAGQGGGNSAPRPDTPPVPPTPGRPTVCCRITITPVVDAVVSQFVRVLHRHSDVFQRGMQLVRVVHPPAVKRRYVSHPGSPTIAAIPPDLLRHHATQIAQWGRNVKVESEETKTKKVKEEAEPKFVDEIPPLWAIKATLALKSWDKVRVLESVVNYPVVRADGTVLTRPGYDADTGLYLVQNGDPIPVPAEPTHADAVAACAVLLNVIHQFPFRDDKAHRSAWLAALLTPIARYAFPGPSPLFCIDANTPGSGKTLLCLLISEIIRGQPFATASYTPDPDETRKAITAIALAGEQLVLFDNIAEKFGNSALDAALTSTVWEDRLLGGNERVKLGLWATFFATGNNIQFAGDVGRRVIPINLHSKEENPDERSDFEHPDLLAWVRDNRAILLGAALTVVAAYIRAGKPQQDVKSMGSFEGWSGCVRSALVWADQPDPCETRAEMRKTADPQLTAMGMLLENWQAIDPSLSGLTNGQIIALVFPELVPAAAPDAKSAPSKVAEILTGIVVSEDARSDLQDAVDTLAPKHTASELGYKLRKFKGRKIGGFVLSQFPRGKGGARWVRC